MKRKISAILIFLIALLPFNMSTMCFAEEKIEGEIIEERYSTIFSDWMKDGIKASEGFSTTINPENFIVDRDRILNSDMAQGYDSSVLHIKKGESFSFEVDVIDSGLYDIEFDYLVLSNGLLPTQGSIKVNGELQYYEAGRVTFIPLWESDGDEFPVNRFGNEVMNKQSKAKVWQTCKLEDPSNLHPDSLKLYLTSGKNKIDFNQVSGEILLGRIKIKSPDDLISYEEYKLNHGDKKKGNNTLFIIEGEKPSYKNNTATRAVVCRDLQVEPYDTNKQLLNTIGGDSWQKGGQTIYYEVEVKEFGLYNLAFKANQSIKQNSVVYRNISIDNKIPFKEAKSFKIPFTNGWKTIVFGDENKAYDIYLEKGKHLIGLEVDITLYSDIVESLSDTMNKINKLSLEIKKLVGNNDDPYRDWVISDYMPNIKEDILGMADSLQKEYDSALKLNGGKTNAKQLTTLKISMDKLRKLAEEPDKLPKKLNQLSEGSGSVGQMLGDTIIEMQNQPLTLDQVYIYSEDSKERLPKYKVSIIKTIVEGTKRFFYSFYPVEEIKVEEGEVNLNIWVNRQRNYVDLMQKMADEDFTKKTGIKVTFSLMPNEQKLILANSAGTNPDVALGISNWLPYELAIRNVALDLRKFEDFDSYIDKFNPGAFLPMIINDGVYGLPETQDFYVLFYRKDILDALNIPVPDTWQDVIDILPELQRYGMNFYAPIAEKSGSKPFMATAPFIYQYGGNIYGKDGMSTGLDDEKSLEAVKLMTDLFTIYGLPMQVPNFYNHFRYGTIPVGIGNFGNYLKLKSAAPEIAGAWDLALHPGVMGSDGVVERWATGSAQSSMIFKGTKHEKESWEFLKWWLSTETQVEYGYQLQTLYGDEFVWNTANLEAFNELPWDEEHKEIISKQWEWLMEVPKIPGSYMVERELSNIWNKIVFDGENPRSAIDAAVMTMNREIQRKMEEFGYIENGKVVTPYRVPTIEQVKGWVRDKNEK